jgi:hypothetical protein
MIQLGGLGEQVKPITDIIFLLGLQMMDQSQIKGCNDGHYQTGVHHMIVLLLMVVTKQHIGSDEGLSMKVCRSWIVSLVVVIVAIAMMMVVRGTLTVHRLYHTVIQTDASGWSSMGAIASCSKIPAAHAPTTTRESLHQLGGIGQLMDDIAHLCSVLQKKTGTVIEMNCHDQRMGLTSIHGGLDGCWSLCLYVFFVGWN